MFEYQDENYKPKKIYMRDPTVDLLMFNGAMISWCDVATTKRLFWNDGATTQLIVPRLNGATT